MTARDRILGKLREVQEPFTDVEPIEEKRYTVPNQEATEQELYDSFIEEAKKLSCVVYEAGSDSGALEIVLDILDGDQSALMWDYEHIPINGLQEAFAQHDIQPAAMGDETVRVGISGVDAALGGTGSLVVISGKGKSRQASLLPLVHVAVVKRDQIMPNLDTFYKTVNKDSFRDTSNIAVITGPSKSADIAMEMIHGMHGPGEVHIVLVP